MSEKRRRVSTISTSSTKDDHDDHDDHEKGNIVHLLPRSLAPIFRLLLNGHDGIAQIKVRKLNLLQQVRMMNKVELFRDNIPHRIEEWVRVYSSSASEVRSDFSLRILVNELYYHIQTCNHHQHEMRHLLLLVRSVGDAKCISLQGNEDAIVKWKTIRAHTLRESDQYIVANEACWKSFHFLQPALKGNLLVYPSGMLVQGIMRCLDQFNRLYQQKQQSMKTATSFLDHLIDFVQCS